MSATWLVVLKEAKGELELVRREVLGVPVGHVALALADLDGGGTADLALAHAGGVELRFGGPGGLSASATTLPLSGDVLDAVPLARSAHARGPGRVGILTVDGTVVVTADRDPAITTVPSSSGRLLRSADVDGDGLGDLIHSADDDIRVLLAVAEQPIGGAP